MLSIPEIETHLNELRRELDAVGTALNEAVRNIGELRDQLQVARPVMDSPGGVNTIGKGGAGRPGWPEAQAR